MGRRFHIGILVTEIVNISENKGATKYKTSIELRDRRVLTSTGTWLENIEIVEKMLAEIRAEEHAERLAVAKAGMR